MDEENIGQPSTDRAVDSAGRQEWCNKMSIPPHFERRRGDSTLPTKRFAPPLPAYKWDKRSTARGASHHSGDGQDGDPKRDGRAAEAAGETEGRASSRGEGLPVAPSSIGTKGGLGEGKGEDGTG